MNSASASSRKLPPWRRVSYPASVGSKATSYRAKYIYIYIYITSINNKQHIIYNIYSYLATLANFGAKGLSFPSGVAGVCAQSLVDTFCIHKQVEENLLVLTCFNMWHLQTRMTALSFNVFHMHDRTVLVAERPRCSESSQSVHDSLRSKTHTSAYKVIQVHSLRCSTYLAAAALYANTFGALPNNTIHSKASKTQPLRQTS